MDADHLDFFKDLEDVKHSFRRFAELVPQEGCVVADGDDANTMDALRGLERPMLTFGLEQGDIHCEGLTWEGGFPSFDLIVRGEDLGRIELSVPGVHNVRNASGRRRRGPSAGGALLRNPGRPAGLPRGGPTV
ncbi:MAG: Mur ligase family protein [Oscillospiraceae bacterium]